jgi:hypothetical protein
MNYFKNKLLEKEYRYQAYGLQILSVFKIDAFQEVDFFEDDHSIINIQYSKIEFGEYKFRDGFLIRKKTDRGFLYVIKNAAAFLIQGNMISVMPICENRNEWQSYLLGAVMSIVLINEGLFVLHGSAVEHKDAALLFLGHSGVGKSSLAMGLGQGGYSVITDDLCAISREKEQLFINSGTKQIRLLEDTVEKLGVIEVVALEHPTKRPKFGFSIDRNSEDKKIRIEKVVELVVDSSLDEEVKVNEIISFDRIALLKKNIYKEDLSKVVGAESSYFSYISLLSEKVKFIRITRRSTLYDLNKLIELIEKNVLGN